MFEGMRRRFTFGESAVGVAFEDVGSDVAGDDLEFGSEQGTS